MVLLLVLVPYFVDVGPVDVISQFELYVSLAPSGKLGRFQYLKKRQFLEH